MFRIGTRLESLCDPRASELQTEIDGFLADAECRDDNRE